MPVFWFHVCFPPPPQASQLYYDANTGIYYYYDAESGRYQFHSRIEVPTAQTAAELCQDKSTGEKKGKKLKKGFKKTAHQDDKVCNTRIFSDAFHIWLLTAGFDFVVPFQNLMTFFGLRLQMLYFYLFFF